MCCKILNIEGLHIFQGLLYILCLFKNPLCAVIYFLKFRESIHIIVRMLPNNMVSYNKRLLSFFFPGQLRWRCTFSKQTQEWVTKPIYVWTAQTFRHDLMECVMQMRDDPNVIYTMPHREKSSKRKRLLQNIAPGQRPEKGILVARWTSRFGLSCRAAPY